MKDLYKPETLIGNILRYGVLLCAGVISTGLVLTFLFPDRAKPSLGLFLAEITEGKLVTQSAPCFWGVECLTNPNGIIALGLLLLISLPIFRVFSTLVLFFLQRDFVYVGIAALVLGVLLTSLLLGNHL